MTSLPLQVLLEIVKWFTLEERMTQLAPVCRYFYNVLHDFSLWRTVNSNAKFTLCSFNSLFMRHARDLRHLVFRYSQKSLTLYTDEFFIEKSLMNCTNLISLDLGNNTSIFSLFFIRYMPFLKRLDITGCQNIAVDSIVTSPLRKETLEVLRMPNCFQVDGKFLVNIVRSLPRIKVVDSRDCGQILVEQARDILQNCKQVEYFSFSPAWGPPDLWAELLSQYKHVKFGYRVSLSGFLYEEEEDLY